MAQNYASTYTVLNGDTLAAIARRKYGIADVWPIIAEHNRLTNPHLIYPGQKLSLPKISTSTIRQIKQTAVRNRTIPDTVAELQQEILRINRDIDRMRKASAATTKQIAQWQAITEEQVAMIQMLRIAKRALERIPDSTRKQQRLKQLEEKELQVIFKLKEHPPKT